VVAVKKPADLVVVAHSIWMNEDPAITEKIVSSFSALHVVYLKALG
jgi:hypothetical protein